MLKLLILIPLLGSVCAQYGGLFKEYKEDLNEYLTSEEVDRLIFANDESVISEKIKNLPDGNMSPPGVGKHHLPMPTMDPALESVPNPPIVKKLPPPQRNNFMSMMKNAARMLTSRTQNRAARSQQQQTMKPVPHFRARPSTLTSSNPDPLEVAFKRIEIMASRAGLNMSSIPRRNQMQVVKRLIPKLPPRMAQLMKTTMDHNSARLYDYLPEPARDPLVEDDPNYLSQFMDGAKVTMDGAEYSLNDHSTHTFEFVEPTHEIIVNPNDDITLSDHQPGTDYSVPTFDSASPSVHPSSLGFSAPPSFEHSAPIGGFGSSGSSSDFVHNSNENIHSGPTGTSMPASLSASIMSSVQKSMSAPMTQTGSVKTSAELLHPLETGPLVPHQHQHQQQAQQDLPLSFSSSQPSYHSSPLVQAAHNIDLRPIAAPLISESHEIFTAEGSENVPTIISPGSSKYPASRGNKALKITSIKNATPSTPIIRVSMPTKDDLKVQKPIRVSIITKDDITPSANPFSATVEPVVTAEVAEVKEVKPIHKTNHHNHHHSHHSMEEILRESSAEVKASSESKPRESVEIRKSESVEIRSKESSSESARTAPTTTTTTTTERTTTPVRTTTTTENTITLPAAVDEFIPLPTSGEKFRGDSVPLASSAPSSSAGLLLKEFDDYADDQDLSSSELLAELKKYNLDYANSLELDYPLAPHPLEYPDHPEHPDNSDPILSTASTLTSPRPSPLPHQPEQPRPHGPPPRPPPRPPMRPRVRPPPRFPHGHPHRPHNNRHHPRRPPPPGPVRPPLRVNDVTVSQIPQMIQKECDYFSEDLCLAVQDYPIEAISEAVSKIDASAMLVKEPGESNWVDGVGRQQEGGYNYKHYFGDGKINNGEGGHRHRDFAGEGGFLCPSKVAYGRVKKGKSYTTGEWKYVVNYGDNSQTLRLEKCLSPGNSCSYVLPHYRTACTQVYNYHRLLAWDSEKGLHMDIFKIPTCCTCHVQGYYIPGQQHGVTPARRRDLPPKLQYAQQQARLRLAHQQSKLQHAQKHQQQQQIQQAAVAAQQQASIRREQAQQAQQAKLQQSKLNDELQELLAQYSSLRERIAKKKNERQSVVTYSMTYSNSTKENSKRESSPQEAPLRNATTSMKRLQRAMVMNIMKRMKKTNSTNMKKKLTQMLKLTSLPSKPTTDSKSHFNGTAHKIKAARALKLHKLAQLLTNINKNAGAGSNSASSSSSSPGKAGNSNNKQAAAITAALSRRLQGQRSLMNMARRTRSGRQHSMESKLDKLKLLLSRSLQKRRPNVVPQQGKFQGKQGASSAGGKNPERLPIKRLQLLQQLQQRRRNSQNNNNNSNSNRTKQRLRPGSKKPNSKVNYSYHPIMDYFGGSKPS